MCVSEIDSDELRCALKKDGGVGALPLLNHKDQQSDTYPQTETAPVELESTQETSATQ